MKPLNKAPNLGTEITLSSGKCLCVAVCLIFTEKRHQDVLDVNKTVKY